MLKILVTNPSALQGEQLRTELKANGLTTEIRLVELMTKGFRDEQTGAIHREPTGEWELHFLDLEPGSEATVRSAIASHQPDRQYGWTPEAKVRAADEVKVKTTLAKANPTPVELRDALGILAKSHGIT